MPQNPMLALIATYLGVPKPLAVDSAGNLKVVSATGGDAVTIADGMDVAEGTTTDVAWVSGAGTVVALLKGIFGKLAGVLTATLTPAASFFHNSAGSAGVAIKASAGTLFGLTINTGGTTTTIALYNSATTTSNLIGTFATTAQGQVMFPAAGVAFSNGLWAVISTSAPADITVVYS